MAIETIYDLHVATSAIVVHLKNILRSNGAATDEEVQEAKANMFRWMKRRDGFNQERVSLVVEPAPATEEKGDE